MEQRKKKKKKEKKMKMKMKDLERKNEALEKKPALPLLDVTEIMAAFGVLAAVDREFFRFGRSWCTFLEVP